MAEVEGKKPLVWGPLAFPPREATETEAAFEALLGFLAALLETPLRDDHETWTNYAAALAAAAIKAASTLCLLVRIDQHQGAPTVARETVELCARFVHCVRHGSRGFGLSLQHEMRQLQEIRRLQANSNDQSGSKVVSWADVSDHIERLSCWMTELGVPIAKKKPDSDCEYVGGMQEAYKLLCLGAHNRPSALMEKYWTHANTGVVSLKEPQPRAYSDDYLRLAAPKIG